MKCWELKELKKVELIQIIKKQENTIKQTITLLHRIAYDMNK